jgi:hypothetical protein
MPNPARAASAPWLASHSHASSINDRTASRVPGSASNISVCPSVGSFQCFW